MNCEWLPKPCTSSVAVPVVSVRPLDVEVTLVSSSHRPSVSALLCALVCHGALSWPVNREAFSVSFHPRHIIPPFLSPSPVLTPNSICLLPVSTPALTHSTTAPSPFFLPFPLTLNCHSPSLHPILFSFQFVHYQLYPSISPASHCLLPLFPHLSCSSSNPHLPLPSPLFPFTLSSFSFVSSIMNIPPVISPFSSRTRRVPPSIPCVAFAIMILFNRCQVLAILP